MCKDEQDMVCMHTEKGVMCDTMPAGSEGVDDEDDGMDDDTDLNIATNANNIDLADYGSEYTCSIDQDREGRICIRSRYGKICKND